MRAGVGGGYAYLPIVVLGGVAGYVFMEMAARLTIVSGESLGQLLRRRGGGAVPVVVFGAVAFGCAAYQAGNLLGGLAGLELLLPTTRYWTIGLALVVALLLRGGSTERIGRAMTFVVLAMVLLFVLGAGQLLLGRPEVAAPRRVSADVLLAVLGTTIVPYNFFLAAGLGEASDLGSMRRGLGLSFGLGVLITACIVVVGTATVSFSSFGDVAATLTGVIGASGRWVLGLGLFAAGLSSATTAPLAAAVAGRELLGIDRGGFWFRLIWMIVLVSGLVVALLDLEIVGVIVLAQVVNGLLLPFVALLVLVLANRSELLGHHTNRWWQNLLGGPVLAFIFYKAGEFFYDLLV